MDNIILYLVGVGCFSVGFLIGGGVTALIHYCFSRRSIGNRSGMVELWNTEGSRRNRSCNGMSNTLRYDKSIYVSNSCPDISEKRISPYAVARFKSEIEESCNKTEGNTLKSETPTEIYAKVS